MNFVKINGEGPPGNQAYVDACLWLFPISYGLKFMSKLELEQDYVVPPLEGLAAIVNVTFPPFRPTTAVPSEQ